MLTRDLLQDLLEYNYWALDRQLQACASLTAEVLHRREGGSFGSLFGTLDHLVAVERLWLTRWQGRSPAKLEPGQFGDIESLATAWTDLEQQMRAFAASQTDRSLAEPFTYSKLNGEPSTYPLWQTLVHFFNHQSYHRGQVTLMLRQSGIEPPKVDFLVWCDAKAGVRS